jgi:hypothetical protein
MGSAVQRDMVPADPDRPGYHQVAGGLLHE